jgi:hydrogenase maturation factor
MGRVEREVKLSAAVNPMKKENFTYAKLGRYLLLNVCIHLRSFDRKSAQGTWKLWSNCPTS